MPRHHHKKKKKNVCSTLSDSMQFLGNAISSSCSNSQCGLKPTPPSMMDTKVDLPLYTNSSSVTSETSLSQKVYGFFYKHELNTESTLAKGVFLRTLEEVTNSILSKTFSQHPLKSEDVYWVKQVVNSLALFGVANVEPHKTLSAPIVTFFLTRCLTTLGVKSKTANLLATGLVLGGMAYSLGLAPVALGMSANFAGRKIAECSIKLAKR